MTGNTRSNDVSLRSLTLRIELRHTGARVKSRRLQAVRMRKSRFAWATKARFGVRSTLNPPREIISAPERSMPVMRQLNAFPRPSKRVTRTAAGLVAIAALGVGASGCGAEQAGSAAVVGEQRVTDTKLATDVAAVTDALDIDSSDQVNQIVLDRLIREDLFEELAKRTDVTITKGELDAFIEETAASVGGREQLDSQLLQSSGVPADAVKGFARTFLLQQKIAEKLVPGGAEEQQGEALAGAVIALSEELDTRVSPRFGTWDPARLSVGPIANDLSAPIVNPEDAALPQINPQAPQ